MAEAMTSDIVGEDEMPFWCDHLDPVSNALIHLHPELNMKKEKGTTLRTLELSVM